MKTEEIFEKWKKILRLENNWDVKLELVNDENFRKTGDFKVDPDDRKAILLLNQLNPKQENFEEVIVHELLHVPSRPTYRGFDFRPLSRRDGCLQHYL